MVCPLVAGHAVPPVDAACDIVYMLDSTPLAPHVALHDPYGPQEPKQSIAGQLPSPGEQAGSTGHAAPPPLLGIVIANERLH